MRRMWKVAAIVAAIVVVVAGAAVAYVIHGVQSIPRFTSAAPGPVVSGSAAPALSVAPVQKGKPQTFLVFSVGSQGLTATKGKELGLPTWRSRYEDGLSDVIMVVTVNPDTGKAGVLSIPRDTWIAKYNQKINALYNLHGVEVLKREVENLTGIPINHLVSVNFTAFADLTDEAGGVNVAVAKPSRDSESGLNVGAGCIHMDGKTALAWVRSRYTDTRDAQGRWSRDPSATDWGRIRRQHEYIHSLLEKLLSPRLVTQVPSLMSVAKKNLTFDEGLGVNDLVTLARAFGSSDSADVETYTYPTTGGWVGNSSVVFAHPDQAAPILSRLKSGLTATSTPSPSATGAAGSTEDTVPANVTPRTGASPTPSVAASAVPTPDALPSRCTP